MRFEKVSYEQFAKDFINICDENSINERIDEYRDHIEKIYNSIKIPKRSTKGSLGYDFRSPFGFNINRGENIIIPTGIRVVDMPANVGLFLLPRSGQGFKYRFALANTIGLIDSDYMNAKNEGHIMVKLSFDGIILPNTIVELKSHDHSYTKTVDTNDNRYLARELYIDQGEAFCQAVFLQGLFVDNDETTGERTGGLGSTDNKS